MFSTLKKLTGKLLRVDRLEARLERLQLALGRVELKLRDELFQKAPEKFDQSEFQVFSQWGEDGIIQHLIRQVGIRNKVFVEFGAENYQESNTRFLLESSGWSGLVIDASEENIEFIRQDPIYWRHNLKAVQSFITRDNIDGLLRESGLSGEIGLLSIDIDGNDYWVLQRISCIQPQILVCEFNALFGARAQVTIPYSADFDRSRAHFSHLYYGASLAALDRLATSKGYSLVGCNTAGNNAFFVRDDCLGNLKRTSPQEAFVESQFRESRDPAGMLTFLSRPEQHRLLGDLPVYDVATEKTIKISEAIEKSIRP